MLSEQSIQLATQASLRLDDISVDSAGSQVKPLGPTQLSKQAPSKPKFVEFECSHYEVFRYASLVTDAVIPKAFWGSKANYTLVLRSGFTSLRGSSTSDDHSRPEEIHCMSSLRDIHASPPPARF